jgi:hypothetical protein
MLCKFLTLFKNVRIKCRNFRENVIWHKHVYLVLHQSGIGIPTLTSGQNP